jgi:hypothetical protein
MNTHPKLLRNLNFNNAITENKMNTDFVIVTSLHNLDEVKRDDNRSWDTYLEWFSETLKIKCPFIIFADSDLSSFIMSHRDKHSTFIINEELEEIPFYHLKDQIQSILDSEEYKTKMSDTNRVECKDSMYSVIQYSKFKWLKRSSEINPFNSKYFFWLDAGASRFIEPTDTEYPSKEALEQLEGIDNTFLIQYNHEYYSDLVSPETLTKDYLWDNRSFICGSMFGGNSKSVELVDKEIDKIMNYMLDNKCLNNEQIALGYLCKEKENLFTRFYRTNPRNHLSLFQEMT